MRYDDVKTVTQLVAEGFVDTAYRRVNGVRWVRWIHRTTGAVLWRAPDGTATTDDPGF